MRKSTVLLSITLVASVTWCAWLLKALAAERVRTAELGEQLERKDLELLRASEVTLGRHDTPAQTSKSATAAVQTAVIAMPQPSAMDVTNAATLDWEARQRQLLRDPKFREARRAQQRVELAGRRANLIRLLGFTPEQADATIDVEIDQQFRYQEDTSAVTPTEEGRKEMAARVEAIERERQDKLRTLLGEDKRLRLQSYMESRRSRIAVDNLRADLSEANALRDDQVEPLIAALHVERSQMQAELKQYRDSITFESANGDSWRKLGERQTELMKEMNARAHASAASILTRPQLDAMDEQLRLDLAEHEARQRLGAVQVKLEQAASAATSPN